jgi:hypothetical protein
MIRFLPAVKFGFCMAGILVFFNAPVRGQVLLNDNFSDGERLTQTPPNSVHWFSGGLSNNVSASSDALVFSGDVGGSTPGSIHGGGLAYFTASGSPFSLSIGQSMTLSFDYSYSQIDSSDWHLEFGLFNSGGSRTATDNTGFNSSSFNAYNGYAAAGVLGPDPSGLGRFKIAERNLTANNLLSTLSYTILGSNVKQTGGASAGITYNASLTIYYADATDMTLTTVIDGETLTRTVSGALFTSFDTVGIFAPGTPGSFKFDDVNVSVISVPEPSNLAITSIGLLTLMGINLFRARQNK